MPPVRPTNGSWVSSPAGLRALPARPPRLPAPPGPRLPARPGPRLPAPPGPRLPAPPWPRLPAAPGCRRRRPRTGRATARRPGHRPRRSHRTRRSRPPPRRSPSRRRRPRSPRRAPRHRRGARSEGPGPPVSARSRGSPRGGHRPTTPARGWGSGGRCRPGGGRGRSRQGWRSGLDDQARLETVEDALAVLAALLLEHGAAREHDVVARAVELDDLALERLPEELVEVRDAPDVDQRGGQEAAHPEVDDQAALDDLDDAAGDRLARLLGGLDAPPRALEAGALLGHDEAPVLVLLGEDQRVDLLAQFDLVVRVDGLADGKLVGGDDPLALVADVDEDLVVVDADDAPGDDVALLEVGEGRVVVGDDLPVDLEQEAAGALDDLGIG